MNIEAMAKIFFKLMTETLGYKRFGVQGGDWGAVIASCVGYTCMSSVTGVHLNMVGTGPAEGRGAKSLSEDEKKFLAEASKFRHEEAGYQAIQGTKPQTLAYALHDSPAGTRGVDRREVPHLERLRRRRRTELHQGPASDQHHGLLGHADD